MTQALELLSARHHADELLESELPAAVVRVHLAPPQHHEPVADRKGMKGIVSDEHHPDAPLPRPGDVPEHYTRLLHAERRGRLVEYEHPRAEMDGARDGDSLALTAAQRATGCATSRTFTPSSASPRRATSAQQSRSSRSNGPRPRTGSAPRTKFRQMLMSGIIARS